MCMEYNYLIKKSMNKFKILALLPILLLLNIEVGFADEQIQKIEIKTENIYNIELDYMWIIENIYINFLNYNLSYTESNTKLTELYNIITNLPNDSENKDIEKYILTLKSYISQIIGKIEEKEKQRIILEYKIYILINTKLNNLLDKYTVKELNIIKDIINNSYIESLHRLQETKKDFKINVTKVLKLKVINKILKEHLEKRLWLNS